MAFTPTKKRFHQDVLAFDGGLNSKYVDMNTPINQTPDCQGVMFDDFGAVGTAYGYTVLNSTPIASYQIDGLHEYINTSATRYLVAACGGALWSWNGSAFATITCAESLYTAGQDVFFRTINDYLYVSNGYIPPYKWNGTTLSRVNASNIAAAACSNTTASNAGNPNGTYNYWVTLVNSANVEGDYARVATDIVAASNQIEVTPFPSAFNTTFNVDIMYLYRNTAGVSNVGYRVTQITVGDTSFIDNIADASLSTTEPPDDAAPPAYVKFIVEHRNRCFGAGNPSAPERLYWSDSADQEVWPSTSWKDIGAGDGEPITGLAIYGNALFVHKNDGKGHGSVWMVYMPDSADVTGSENWYFDKVAVSDGAVGHKSLFFYNKIMGFMNAWGVYGFTGQDLALSPAYSAVGVFPVESLSFLIEPTVKSWKTANLGEAAAINYDNKVWLSVPGTAQSAYNDQVWVFDYVRASSQENVSGAWTKLDNPPANCFSFYDGDMYAGSSKADGYVYKMNSGRNHNGSAIDSYFKTVWLGGKKEHQENTKVFRYLHLWVETSGDWNLTVEWWLDFEQTEGSSTTVNLASGGSEWDEAVWDTDLWGGGNAKVVKHIELTDDVMGRAPIGQVIQFKFSTSTANQYFKVYKMQLEYNLRRIRNS